MMPGTRPVENDLKDFFQRVLKPSGVDVIGVSVRWDYRKIQSEIEEQNKWEIEQKATKWEMTNKEGLRSAQMASARLGSARQGSKITPRTTPRSTPRTHAE